MELLSLEHINEKYLSYSDIRSVKKFIMQKKISIIKMGKKYFIKKEEFENMMSNITGGEKIFKCVPVKPQLLNDSEKGIYAQLLRKI